MAIYHCSIKIISRGKGKSAVAAAFSDRAVLWNAVEKIEKAKNAQLAREIEIALPRELTREQGISLVREYVKTQFVNAGMCADFAIHDTGGVPEGISFGHNPHAHIMLTMRPIQQGGASGSDILSGSMRFPHLCFPPFFITVCFWGSISFCSKGGVDCCAEM